MTRNKWLKRMLFALIGGFCAGILVMAIAIFFGYVYAYAHDVSSYQVKIAELTIYELTRVGNEYVGSSDSTGINMGIVCCVCMMAFVLCTAAYTAIKQIRTHQNKEQA